MKKSLLALSITALSFTASAGDLPYDKKVKAERQEQAQAAAKLVIAYGYRCDSISSFNKMAFSSGFTINCNRFNYSYDIEDVGGRYVVTVN